MQKEYLLTRHSNVSVDGKNSKLKAGLIPINGVNLIFLFTSRKLNSKTAMVLARAFTTSQSADAHVILFRRIWSIAEQDTGVPVTFHHIHGVGIESIVTDGHRGQALGIFTLQSYLQI